MATQASKSKKKSPRSAGRKPEYMITYLCPHCGFDSGRTELDVPPACFYCDAKTGLVEIKREKLSAEVMANRMKLVTDRMMDNLRKAWGISEKEWPQDPEQEMLLLETMAKGKKFQDAIEEMGEKMKRREKEQRKKE